ncbi:MAG: chemotaxis protein CheW [Candidatus Methanogaster sp.]|uniref:Chemotaxis protein CheW n=1 Tax=Candidatus Methanogaster sp. TaxID=3386292 RepID=A0AC61L547_9EURY|nr:MAG: chemotaxis protein CheW [ANME-2 cluster archaeon]
MTEDSKRHDAIEQEQQLVVFELGEEEFGVDISQVREIIRTGEIAHIPNASAYVKGVINLRGQITTIVDLKKRFGLDHTDRDQEERIIIVELKDNIVGMMVDSVSEVIRLPTKDIEPVPPIIASKIDTHYLKGVGKLENRLLILIDLGKILAEEEMLRMG